MLRDFAGKNISQSHFRGLQGYNFIPVSNNQIARIKILQEKFSYRENFAKRKNRLCGLNFANLIFRISRGPLSANQPFSFVLFRKDLISQMGEISISVITQSRKNLRRRNFCVNKFLQMVLFFAWNNFCDLSPIREHIFIFVKTRPVKAHVSSFYKCEHLWPQVRIFLG